MNEGSGGVPADFPLNTIGTGVDRIAPPVGPFEAAGDWQQRWGVYSTAAKPSRVGALAVRRSVASGGRGLLDMRYEKLLSGGRQTVAAKIHLRADSPLSTPDDWAFQVRVLDAENRTIESTQIRKSVRVEEGALIVEESGGRRRTADAGPFTLNWALFDAVGRLPRERFRPMAFTLIDHFDQVKPDHRLSFRTRAQIAIRGRRVPLVAYDQVGRGAVPWVWWVDDQGRLLAAVSGLEVYLQEPAES